MTRLSQEDQEALQWARQHRANIEKRNKVLIGIGIIAEVILLGGVLNYYMLAPIANQYLSSFIAEFGFVVMLVLLNTSIIARAYKIDKARMLRHLLVAVELALSGVGGVGGVDGGGGGGGGGVDGGVGGDVGGHLHIPDTER